MLSLGQRNVGQAIRRSIIPQPISKGLMNSQPPSRCWQHKGRQDLNHRLVRKPTVQAAAGFHPGYRHSHLLPQQALGICLVICILLY